MGTGCEDDSRPNVSCCRSFNPAACVELLSSSNPFKNSQALGHLMEARDFSDEFVALAREIEKKGDTVAFHIHVRSIARAYLHLAGETETGSLDEETLYVLSAYEGC